MPAVMPPADRRSISRLAVPFQFCIFGGFGDPSESHAMLVHIKVNHITLLSTIHNRFLDLMLCLTICCTPEMFDAMLNGFLLSCTICFYVAPFDV